VPTLGAHGTAAPLARGVPRPWMHRSQRSRPRHRTLVNCRKLPPRDDSREKCASDWEDLRILVSRTRDRGMRCARAARTPRGGFAVVATTHIANLLVLRFAPRARMGRSGPRLLSLDAGVTGAARRAVDASDGSASTACFASMWHPPLRRSGGVFRDSARAKTQATCGFAAGRLIIQTPCRVTGRHTRTPSSAGFRLPRAMCCAQRG